MHESDIFRKASDKKAAAYADSAARLAKDNDKMQELYDAMREISNDLAKHGVAFESGVYLDTYRAIRLTRNEDKDRSLWGRFWKGPPHEEVNLLMCLNDIFVSLGDKIIREREGDRTEFIDIGSSVHQALESIAGSIVEGKLPAYDLTDTEEFVKTRWV